MFIINPSQRHIYSRPLDIHLTTNHSEINELVDVIFKKYFNTRKKEITKKHLKVLLLDLYVAWNTDPKLEISVHMSPNSYTSIKRYNQLSITSIMIDVVTVLRNHNVISCHNNKQEKNNGQRTIIKHLLYRFTRFSRCIYRDLGIHLTRGSRTRWTIRTLHRPLGSYSHGAGQSL